MTSPCLRSAKSTGAATQGRRGACAPPKSDSTDARGSTFQRDAQPHCPLLARAEEDHEQSPKQRCCPPHAFILVLTLSPVHLELTCSQPGRARLAICLLGRKPSPCKTLVPSKQGGDSTVASYYLTQVNKTVLTLGLEKCLLLHWGKAQRTSLLYSYLKRCFSFFFFFWSQ